MDSYISNKFQQKKFKEGAEINKEKQIRKEKWNSEIIIDSTPHVNLNKLVSPTKINP